MKQDIEHSFYKHINAEVERINTKADKHRNRFYALRILLIVIAGTITVVSGWNGERDKSWPLNLILILGALTTSITAIDSLLQLETKKNVYRLMLFELRAIRSEIVYYFENHTSEELKEQITTKLFPKYIDIMAYSKALLVQEKKNERVNSEILTSDKEKQL